MRDHRFAALARQLTAYSTQLKKGESVLLDLYDVPESFAIELIRETRKRGAQPVVRLHSAGVTRELLRGSYSRAVSHHSQESAR